MMARFLRRHDAQLLHSVAAELRAEAREIEPNGSSKLAGQRRGLNVVAQRLERRAGQARRGERS